MNDSAFTLTKWYLDCVTTDGEAVILYSAQLAWRGVHLACNSLLHTRHSGVESRFSMARAQIGADPDKIEVKMPRLKVEGAWARIAPPFRTRVYEGDDGFVDWNCLQPGSNVRLRLGERELTGHGYAECLTVTVPPWRLKLKQLRWGRFVGEGHSLAWIDWRGSYNSAFAVLNGERCALTEAKERAVQAERASLDLHDSLPIRTGKLGATVLPFAPQLRRLLPRSLASIDERKWLSRGTLTCGDQISHGWVIHEVVHWDL